MNKIGWKLNQLIRNEKGAVLVLVAAGMTVFLGLTALVIDGGGLYLERARLQKAMDAAVLAGAQELPNRPEMAKQEAERAAAANGVEASELMITFNASNTTIQATVVRSKQLKFVHALGISDPPVRATAKVELRPLTSVAGVIPLGVDASRQLAYGDAVILKVGEPKYGNFVALQMPGPGASDYREDLKNGYQETISIGDILDTKHGNMVGPTKQAIEDRMARCPYHGSASCYDYPKDCPLVVLVPVYKPIGDGTRVDQVQVVGFASFFIERIGSTNEGVEIIGRFIQTAYSGSSSPSQGDYGAYGYKLIE
ncbi:TadE/TadG family type IV pilus assembly protein [Effusibacillus lacus]|uniref:Putative Flp pilus-assembly TadG-like N-terminal domain-containing protein n=1 Tax=Effusibacillus lacus TaxID=1348429 RepID=A0A292YRI6_9BACL|nr:TadE/TadG family type IV pilus assembly protein [Effusibacillus lacus]TCS70379.1 putative Flp pilus-assembly TadE/G-like protein [Effusibacillus lacus]GAX91531.1 hypothetical protein EFBL_3221 [Effusibacillus lacus]